MLPKRRQGRSPCAGRAAVDGGTKRRQRTTAPAAASSPRSCKPPPPSGSLQPRSSGFFHIVTNHGSAVDSAVSAVRAFHELPPAIHSAFYTPVSVGSVAYSTIPIIPGPGPLLPWRDTLQVRFGPPAPDLSHLSAACRDALLEYQRFMTEFRKKMAGLLSEALGVDAERLERAMQVEGWLMACHYYPPCSRSSPCPQVCYRR